ncbi:MAG: hypothetical protein EOP48_10250 [Sphingobacteriales bacterium]|nr:MAG: hypothetical protein EOP48_10250 [Sphingobacteriales bacterium]
MTRLTAYSNGKLNRKITTKPIASLTNSNLAVQGFSSSKAPQVINVRMTKQLLTTSGTMGILAFRNKINEPPAKAIIN